MENPWADAWNEPPKPSKESESSQESDLATPSWSTDVGIQWTEPSDLSSLWNNPTVGPTWTLPKSPYDDIPIGRTSSQSDANPTDSPVSERPDTGGFQTAPTSPTPGEQDLPPPDSPPLAPHSGEATPVIPTRSGSPDAFGTFETANTDTDVTSWTASVPSFSADVLDDGNAWNTAWEPSPDSEQSKEKTHPDEWEIAKLQKQKQDQHVPPELLASIMQQAGELSRDLWPESNLEEGETRQPSKDFLSDVPSLTSALEIFVPEDLALPPSTAFTRSFTAKHMNEALRLTKNLPMTLSSPLATYMASKGSTAWETSVRTRQDLRQDDVLPPGWRMVQKDNQESAPPPGVKKKAGGLLSFLGLKGTESSTDPAPQKRSPSTSRPASIIDSARTPRSSLDGNYSKPSAEYRSSISQPPTNPAVIAPSASSSGSSGPSDTSPIGDQKVPQETTAQPSAVSRFFGRFSRSSAAPSISSSSRSHSIASPSDDVEFFSDIVPSVNDGADDDETLTALTTLVTVKSPSSLSATPLPQPLPPPPKPSLPPPTSAPGIFATSPIPQPKVDDLFSLFDNPMAEQPLSSNESSSIQPLVPLMPGPKQAVSAPNSSLVSWRPSLKSASPIPAPILAPVSRAQTPTTAPTPSPPQRRNVMAIMSDTTRSNTLLHQAPLPPPPLPPPPPISVANPSRPPPLSLSQPSQKQKASLLDDDEFSEFLSSPATTDPSPQPSNLQGISSNASKVTNTTVVPSTVSTFASTASFSSTSSDQSLLHSSSFDFGSNGFTSSNSGKSSLGALDDDFSEFISPASSTLPMSLPPRPPSKGRPPPPKVMVPLVAVGQLMQPKTRQSLPSPPTPTKPDHSRTATLVESAAARPGRWPTPPSPTRRTVALPPPPPSAGKNGLDIFGDLTSSPQPPVSSSHLGGFGSFGVLPPVRAMSPPLNPVKINGNPSASPLSWPTNGSKSMAPPPAKTSGGGQKMGGLSAQDLSFFEGL